MAEMIGRGSGGVIAVVGSGVIGLSVALELRRRGHRVQVFEAAARDARRAGQASFAAAGMLAAGDPDRPQGLRPFAEESLRGYEKYLQRVEATSLQQVPFQTFNTVEYGEDGTSCVIEEWSVDPRQLHSALMGAVGDVQFGAEVSGLRERSDGVDVEFRGGSRKRFAEVFRAAGAWMGDGVRPRKGQMLRVALPEGLTLDRVHRAKDVYVVPRRFGPQAGSAVIGATVEDCGFDVAVNPDALADLRWRAARLVPELAGAEELESWAGLRPGTADDLPVIGFVSGSGRQLVAGGHFRDGILLAPATAMVVADLLEGREPAVDLAAFDPGRFAHRER